MTPEAKARELCKRVQRWLSNGQPDGDLEVIADEFVRDVERETLERAAKVAEAEESTRSGDQVYPCMAIAAVIRSLKKPETAA